MPRNWSRKIFFVFVPKIGPVFKSKKIIDKNLSIFNKELSSLQKQLIISNMWRNYGITLLNTCF